MADHRDEIDDIFKSRFEGVKNKTYDPHIEWAAVQQGLSQDAIITTSAITKSSVVLQKIAATIFVAVLSSIGINESTLMQDYSSPNAFLQKEGSTPVEYDFASEAMDQSNNAEAFTQRLATQASVSSDITDIDKSTSNLMSVTAVAGDHEIESKDETHINAPFYDIKDEIVSNLNDTRRESAIALLKGKAYEYQLPEVVNPNYVPENPIIEQWMDDHVWFFRGGMRTGTGEANSAMASSSWNVSPTFSFGYGFSLTDRSFISLEIGVLRRSGNAIERVRQTEVSPVVQSFANNLSAESNVTMHRGMVATRMDYVHIPVMYNYMVNGRWSLSSGVFVDYLFAAQNESITVYNASEYVAASSNSADVSSLDGLNRFRYGAMLGAERQLTRNLASYGRVMSPINSAIDEDGGYESFGIANRMIDAQLGLIYRF